jgi:hypothetical protein
MTFSRKTKAQLIFEQHGPKLLAYTFLSEGESTEKKRWECFVAPMAREAKEALKKEETPAETRNSSIWQEGGLRVDR